MKNGVSSSSPLRLNVNQKYILMCFDRMIITREYYSFFFIITYARNFWLLFYVFFFAFYIWIFY